MLYYKLLCHAIGHWTVIGIHSQYINKLIYEIPI